MIMINKRTFFTGPLMSMHLKDFHSMAVVVVAAVDVAVAATSWVFKFYRSQLEGSTVFTGIF